MYFVCHNILGSPFLASVDCTYSLLGEAEPLTTRLINYSVIVSNGLATLNMAFLDDCLRKDYVDFTF